MGQLFKSSLLIMASFALPISLAGIAYAIARTDTKFYSQSKKAPDSAAAASQEKVCQTLVADPSPPVNLRSSPVVAPDNTVKQLPNGTQLTITDESEGWLKVSQPTPGWIYQELTVTSCLTPSDVAKQVESPDQGARLFAIATEQYQSGNISGAIALAKTVSPDSSTHQAARGASLQWERDWQRAESDYYVAQKALRDGRWQDVINQVQTFPDNRYWKEKLAPIVQQAVKKIDQKSSPP
jgi:Bacterial SH3 domain